MAFNFSFETPETSSQVPVHVTGTAPGENKISYLRIAVTVSFGAGTAGKSTCYKTLAFPATTVAQPYHATHNIAIVPRLSSTRVVYTASYAFSFTASGTYQ